jgi:hypothetical protein
VEPCKSTIRQVCATIGVTLKKKIANRFFVPDISVADTCVFIVDDAVSRRVA